MSSKVPRDEAQVWSHVAELSNVPLLGRSALMSRIQRRPAQAPPDANFPRLIAFLQFWKWLLPYLLDFVHKDAPYATYPSGKTGIFGIPIHRRMSLFGLQSTSDSGHWYRTEAETVAENMKDCSSTLHSAPRGHVYYMGETGEINENCLGTYRQRTIQESWPAGALGSFALIGNHEMYSGGQAISRPFWAGLGCSIPIRV